MEIVGCRDISRFHSYLARATRRTRPYLCLRTLSRRSCDFWIASSDCLIKANQDVPQRQFCLISSFPASIAASG